MKRKRPNLYAVAVGRKPGIYYTWEECSAQVNGFSGAQYKGFDTLQQADEYISAIQNNKSSAITWNYTERQPTQNNNNNSLVDLVTKRPKISQNVVPSASSPSISLTNAVKQPKFLVQSSALIGKTTLVAATTTAPPATNNLSSLLKMEQQRNQHKNPVLPTVRTVTPFSPATQKLLEQKKQQQQQQRMHTEKMQKLKQEVQLESIKKGNHKGASMMLRQGYQPGLGLGKNSNGITSMDAILPKEVKRNKQGLGYTVRDFNDQLPLCTEQQRVFDAVMEGKNVFFTGCAGTGKSMLLARLRWALELTNKNLAVTASTGVAAVNIGGITLHRFAGIGLQSEPAAIWDRVWHNRKIWRQTEVLIIDEISMIDGNFFDILESCARKVRATDRPFGGLQLILAGDFFQLPPIQKQDKARLFCFEAKSWSSCIDVLFELKQIHRQSDADFVSILGEIRLGRCTKKCVDMLNRCKDTVLPTPGPVPAKQSGNSENNSILNPKKATPSILPTVLYCRNVQVDALNTQHLDELPGTVVTFTSIDETMLDQPKHLNSEMDLSMASMDEGVDKRKESLLTMLNQGCLATEKIQLKVGAQVMLLRNLSNSLANGSRGVIKGFHKMDKNSISTLLEEKDVSPKWFDHNRMLPVVLFRNGQETAIEPELFTCQSRSFGVAYRTQVPLKLAYALTIHKSQGLTLDFAKLSLSDVFEPGQAYVALSRLRGMDGLKILDWKPSAIKAHPKVIEFYNTLQGAQTQITEDKEDNNNVNNNTQQNNNNTEEDLKIDLIEEITLIPPEPATVTQTQDQTQALTQLKLEPIEISDEEEYIPLITPHNDNEYEFDNTRQSDEDEAEDTFEQIQLLSGTDEQCE